MRRYLAAGIWLALTATATLIVWAAVSVVAADVTDRPAPVVAHHDVVVALQAGTTTTTSTAPPVTARTAPAAPAPGRPGTTASGGRIGSGTVPGPATTTTTAPPATPPTTRPQGHPAPTTTTPSTTTTLPAGSTATFTDNGGAVSVVCTSFGTIRLVAAVPNDGFQAQVISGGPTFVAVNFAGQGQNLPISAICFFGQPLQGNTGFNGP